MKEPTLHGSIALGNSINGHAAPGTPGPYRIPAARTPTEEAGADSITLSAKTAGTFRRDVTACAGAADPHESRNGGDLRWSGSHERGRRMPPGAGVAPGHHRGRPMSGQSSWSRTP